MEEAAEPAGIAGRLRRLIRPLAEALAEAADPLRQRLGGDEHVPERGEEAERPLPEVLNQAGVRLHNRAEVAAEALRADQLPGLRREVAQHLGGVLHAALEHVEVL